MTNSDLILKNVAFEPNTGCWIWLRRVDRQGYGRLVRNKRETGAHRISYAAFKNDPCDLLVCHHCDNPGCVNPDHLFLGTKLDNNRDSIKKGRANRGKRNAKLNPDQVFKIREIYSLGNSTYKEIAEDFNVSTAAITDICLRRNWAHL